jgi:FdrA protein
VRSNVRTGDPDGGGPPAAGHVFMDMGAPSFTVGRPHPLISPELKMERLFGDLADPAVAVVLTDIVLGFGVSPLQAFSLVRTMDRAAAASDGGSRKKTVIASVCGTESDNPSRAAQVALLRRAGVIVAGNNAQAARWASAAAMSGYGAGHGAGREGGRRA